MCSRSTVISHRTYCTCRESMYCRRIHRIGHACTWPGGQAKHKHKEDTYMLLTPVASCFVCPSSLTECTALHAIRPPPPDNPTHSYLRCAVLGAVFSAQDGEIRKKRARANGMPHASRGVQDGEKAAIPMCAGEDCHLRPPPSTAYSSARTSHSRGKVNSRSTGSRRRP